MRTILTIHGVGVLGGRGPWQEPISRVLGPHFEFEKMKYGHYRWLGLFTSVIEPWALLAGWLVMFVWWREVPGRPLWLSLLAVVPFSVAAAFIRRVACARFFMKRTSSTPYRLKPHVIAHSMGTHILGIALRKSPTARIARVILTGCVLPTNYPWEAIRYRFEHVLNEVGREDIVPRMAGIAKDLRVLPRTFGPSGKDGFEEKPGFIHSVREPELKCPLCQAEGIVARIHNVIWPSGHSGTLTPAHAARYWAPWLWGMEPPEYGRWLELCLLAGEHYQEQNWPKLAVVEAELINSEWSWTQTRTLMAYISHLVEAHPKRVKVRFPVTGRVLREVYLRVCLACQQHQDRSAGWELAVRSLNPEIAVLHAVDSILKTK